MDQVVLRMQLQEIIDLSAEMICLQTVTVDQQIANQSISCTKPNRESYSAKALDSTSLLRINYVPLVLDLVLHINNLTRMLLLLPSK